MVSVAELTQERLCLLAKQQVEAGLLDPVTLKPQACVEHHDEWYRIRLKKHVFDMPRAMTNPSFLAAGGYGGVAECEYKGRKVAVKKIAFPGRSNESDALRLVREVIVLRKAQEQQQESLCHLLDVYTNVNCTSAKMLKHIYIVMPLYAQGCLEDFAVTSPAMFHTIASHTLEAVHWLHAHKILHRDIKRENIFYDAGANRAVLGDMGNCRRWCAKKMTGKDEVGTRCYLAPEFMSRQAYSYASDVWSLGVCWYEMLCMEDTNDTMIEQEDKEQLGRQRTFCYHVNPGRYERVPRRLPAHITWSQMTWSRVEDIERKWAEPAYSRLLRSIFVFDQEHRALTTDLYADPFFADNVPSFTVVPMPGMELTDYDKARAFLFEARTMQHTPSFGSLQRVLSSNTCSTVCPSDAASEAPFNSQQSDAASFTPSPLTSMLAHQRCCSPKSANRQTPSLPQDDFSPLAFDNLDCAGLCSSLDGEGGMLAAKVIPGLCDENSALCQSSLTGGTKKRVVSKLTTSRKLPRRT